MLCGLNDRLCWWGPGLSEANQMLVISLAGFSCNNGSIKSFVLNATLARHQSRKPRMREDVR